MLFELVHGALAFDSEGNGQNAALWRIHTRNVVAGTLIQKGLACAHHTELET